MLARGHSTNPGWLQEGIIRGHMLGKTMLPSDEELGKKDDDHRFAPARRSGWSIWNHASRWRRRRVVLAVVGALLVWYLLFWSGNTGAGSGSAADGEDRFPLIKPTPGMEAAEQSAAGSVEEEEPVGPPPGVQRPKQGETALHVYDGQIRFFRLGPTLRRQASQTGGYARQNRNVVFAVSSLKSASTLLPVLCEMAKWSRNYVHAVIFGREDLSWEELWEINGVDKEKCPAKWHDARPDYAEYSTEGRAQSAAMGAMTHIGKYLHPQVVITDDSLSEDGFFSRAMQVETKRLDVPLIEIPKDKAEELTWMTRLDAGSLSMWHAATVDILVQVPPESSSVLGLLHSLAEADYGGLQPPRITLELPAELDESVKLHLGNFQWPPFRTHSTLTSGLTIRRRITNHRATQEDSAIRFLELFYPTSADNSHVLLLSPQAQLSPQFFHFIRYALLEYKYSTYSQNDNTALMGLSLSLPSVLLDGKTPLDLPGIADMHTERYTKLNPSTKSSPFLWQAPNNHAALFFGDKWAELHSFLSNRVSKHQQNPKPTRQKLVSETLPAWTEYMLEFMRARGYSLLYPAKTESTFVTVHNELYHAPEEFVAPQLQRAKPLVEPEALEEAFLRAEDEETPKPPKDVEQEVIKRSVPLHLALPFTGDLPEIPHLPYLLYNGTMILPANASSVAASFARSFTEEVGGCTIPAGRHRKVVPGEAGDLFCFGDEDEADWEDDVPEEVEMFEAVVEDALMMTSVASGSTMSLSVSASATATATAVSTGV